MSIIDAINPYLSYRVGQREAILDIIRAALGEEKIITLKGPTGCGKSLILTMTARALHEEGFDRCIYTTPQKALVNQLARDKCLGITTLLGRANYLCPKVKSRSAVDCPIPSRLRRKTCPHCEYQAAKDAFLSAPLGAATLDKILVDRSIPTPNILVVDESQGLETKLIDQRAIELPESVDVTNLEESVQSWATYIEMEKMKYETKLERAFSRMVPDQDDLSKFVGAVAADDVVKIAKTLTRITRVLEKAKSVYKIIKEQPDGFVIDQRRNFKLIDGRKQFEELIMNIDLVILASGTPCTQMLADAYVAVDAPHPIEIDRRRVYYDPCGRMNVDEREKTIDLMAEKIVELHHKYDRNTLVHCHSYPIADRLGQAVYDSGVRCMWVEKKERDESIQRWKDADNVCLMSVACEEGLDLPGEKYPLNIIAKVPFGYRGDEWFIKRIAHERSFAKDRQWENVSVAVAIQQAAGRCTRAPTDFSETYILDSSFENFYRKYYQLFEPWFRDALMRRAA